MNKTLVPEITWESYGIHLQLALPPSDTSCSTFPLPMFSLKFECIVEAKLCSLMGMVSVRVPRVQHGDRFVFTITGREST